MIVWGGLNGTVLANGAVYDIATNTWKMMSTPPSILSGGRSDHVAVWTGSQMVLFGGSDASNPSRDAVSYSPATDTWKILSVTSLLPRAEVAGVWSTTTNELIVWGGFATTCSSSGDCSDGASYKPSTDTWTPLPAAPIPGRHAHMAVWTGSAMLVYGGESEAAGGAALSDGALYNPSTKTWTILPATPSGFDGRYANIGVAQGGSTLIFGGVGGPSFAFESTGAIFSGSSWSAITTPTATELNPPARARMAAWGFGGQYWIWGGLKTGTTNFSGAGASYNPSSGGWTAMDVSAAPAGRARATVVNTGKAAIVWGGQGEGTFFGDGSAFVP